MLAYQMDVNEKRVRDHLESLGLRATRYPRGKRANQQTPDFKIFHHGQFIAYCEVKSVNPEHTDQPTSGEMENKDSRFNRLVSDIHKAAKQFAAVNPQVERPNVLAFVNNDFACGVDYLEDVLSGVFSSASGRIYPFFRRYSNGIIKNEKFYIHLFVWMDLSEVTYRVWGRSSDHVALLERFFPIRDT